MQNFTIIPNEILDNCQLTISARYLFIVMLKYCGQDEYCFPGQKTLAKALGLTDRQIRNLLDELEKHGLINRKRKGWNRSNTYRVTKDLVVDRKSASSLLRSKFPVQNGSVVPNKNTYQKGKYKRSSKGLEALRDVVGRYRVNRT